MSKFYTEEMKNYILNNYRGKTALQLQQEFNNKFKTNISYMAIKSYLTGHKIRIGHKNKSKFKGEHITFLKENVKGISLKELTIRFNNEFNMNLNESCIANLKYKYNLKSGINGGQFVKGQAPLNKGKKWDEFMSKEAQEASRKSLFKKGNVPGNRRPIGSERIDKRDGSILIKVQDGHLQKNWLAKSRYIYEQKHGKIPKGYKVIFADGDNRNFDLNNLILVSNSEELILNRNKLIGSNAELTRSGVAIAKLIDKVNKTKNGVKNG